MIVNSWEVSRGRSYELDKNSPGSASVTIIDLDGEVDPTTAGYDFDPGTPAAIALKNPITGTQHTVFRGWVASLNYDLYQSETYAVATLELVDGLDRLSRMEMFEGGGWSDIFTSEAQEGDVWFDADTQVADRINRILDRAGWPSAQREIFSGNVPLKSVTYAYRTPALTALLDCADAEFPAVASNFYIQKTGEVTFHGRLARFNHNSAQYHISHWTAGDLSSSADALIFSLTFDKDVGRVINAASATPKDIADADISGQYVEDTASIAQYGTRSESFDNLLTDGDHFDGATPEEATLKFAEFLVNNYSQPRTRVNTITLKGLPAGHAKAAETWRLMCNVDISDVITLFTSHMGGGGFAEEFFVEGIRIRKGPHELDVEMELDLSPLAYFDNNPFA